MLPLKIRTSVGSDGVELKVQYVGFREDLQADIDCDKAFSIAYETESMNQVFITFE